MVLHLPGVCSILVGPNAHIVAFWQNRYARGYYKPLAKEFHEGGRR